MFLITLALLVGIFVWPEATLCVVLFQAGHPILGVLAILATYFNVRDLVKARLKAFVSPTNLTLSSSSEDEDHIHYHQGR